MRNRQQNLERQKEYYKSHRDVSFSTVTIRCSFVGNVDVNENVRLSFSFMEMEVSPRLPVVYRGLI